MERFVVVGGGIAGHRAAVELARAAPGASVDLLSEEDHLPYDRPPLSKEILKSSKTAAEIILSGAHTYAQDGVVYHPGTHVTAIDRARHAVVTRGGEEFSYDRLLLATGSRTRELPDACVGDAPVYYLRTLQDALDLHRELREGRHVVVVGGGFIGLEVAAAARSRFCRVTVLEAQSRILARGMPELLSHWVDRLHRDQGVEIWLGTQVAAMRRDGAGVILSGPGWTLAADVVVAGIGVSPNVELAASAGLAVDDGIVVDAQCRTSDPDIFAAGEVTSRPVMHGALRRIESWRSSGEQGAAAARAMAGQSVTFDDVPSLWSDQYDTNIQAIGFPDLAVQHTILGDAALNAWTLVGLDEAGAIIGGVTVNRGRDASALKRAVKQRADLAFMQPKAALATP